METPGCLVKWRSLFDIERVNGAAVRRVTFPAPYGATYSEYSVHRMARRVMTLRNIVSFILY
jgi:hypothetical protein